MSDPIRSVLVLGGGTAGLLTALTLRARLPQLVVQVIRSDRLGVIGVGEATTPWFPQYLHNVLGLERGRFYREVHPVWKLGNRLEWGPADRTHFNYPFGAKFLELRHPRLSKENVYFCLAEDMSPANSYEALMERNQSPVLRRPDGRFTIDERFGYHIENRTFVAYLERIASERGIEIRDQEVTGAARDPSGDIVALDVHDGPAMRADLYVDCTGFRAQLIGQTLNEPFISYGDSLFCDTAITGTWSRDAPVHPYTTATTMDHGWCWRTEFEGHISRGYVFSSQFCSRDTAIRELRDKNPQLGENLTAIKFTPGRRENFWVKNVAAVGNAAGFVEPLESTGLQMIGETAITLANALADCDGRPTPILRELANRHVARWWEDIRAFLAVHFKFNTRLDTPFWRHCRAETNLASARPLVDFYQQVGPSALCYMFVSQETVFGYGGYLALLIGQRAPTAYVSRLSDDQRRTWLRLVNEIRQDASHALAMEEAIELVHGPNWRW